MRDFLRYRFWDWFLCGCIATGLVFNLFAGFVLEDGFSSSIPLVIAFMAAAMAVMVLFTYTRVTTVIGVVIGIVLLLFVMVYVRANHVFEDEASEMTNSLFIALAVAVLVAVLVYLACRSKPGTIILFLAGNILICGSYFLQFDVQVWSFLLFMFAVFVMFWYRNYMLTLQRSQAGKIRLPRFMAQSLVICLIAIVLGGGAYYGVVRPLNPPTRELKLIEQLKQMNVIKKAGLYSVQELLDPSLQSSSEPDQTEEGTQQEEEQQEEEEQDSGKDENEEQQEQKSPKERLEEAQNIYYILNFIKLPVVPILIAVLVAAAFILRLMLRKNWKHKVDNLTAEQQIINYYIYFLTRLERAGFKRPVNHTLYEYASDMDHTLQEFAVKDADFTKLTELYVRSLYGRNRAAEEEAELFRRFYNSFHKALRKEIGVLKYFIKIFRI